MSLDNIVEGTYGQYFEVTVVQDGTAKPVSEYTTAQTFILLTPTGTIKTKTGEFTTDGSDGKVRFLIEDGDFDDAGIWRVQVQLEKGDAILPTVFKSFKVHEHLNTS